MSPDSSAPARRWRGVTGIPIRFWVTRSAYAATATGAEAQVFAIAGTQVFALVLAFWVCSWVYGDGASPARSPPPAFPVETYHPRYYYTIGRSDYKSLHDSVRWIGVASHGALWHASTRVFVAMTYSASPRRMPNNPTTTPRCRNSSVSASQVMTGQ